jgi:hypothetical protein
MGKHYVPQRYLAGFASTGDARLIWMLDKQTGALSNPAIKRVAQERSYYPEEVERILARQVEDPAHKVLRRLREGSRLRASDRSALALYVATMIARVPRRRRQARELVPDTLERTCARVREALHRIAQSKDPSFLRQKLAELSDIQERYAKSLPDDLQRMIEAPWPSAVMIETIERMVWRVVRTGGPVRFVTSDNPAYYFESLGIGREESELVLPLSTDIALVGNWQGEPGSTIYEDAQQQIVREINRRQVHGAERFVFYHCRATWLETLAATKRPHLSRIIWQ